MPIKVAPDGKWGWIVAIGSALNGLSTIPIIQGFGLIFKDSFTTLNLTATDTAIIINVNLAFGMLLGLINGPLLKTFGYRKIALVASIIYSFGITLTAFANNFTFIIISYGILASIGMGMSMSAFSFALNSYFTTKRDRAVALAITITGLGPILIPQMASLSLSFYGIQGTILLFGAYSLHSIVGSLLLQPLKWHMKNAPICNDPLLEIVNKISTATKEAEISYNMEEKTNIYSSRTTINSIQRKRKITTSSIDHDVEIASIYGFDTPSPQKISMDVGITKSVHSINLGSSLNIFEELIPTANKKFMFNDVSQNFVEQDTLLSKEANEDATKRNYSNDESKSVYHRIVRQISNLYDFDLLRDPIYINIMLGMSIAIFAEANFSMLTPFILADMNIETAKIAIIMSVIAIVDLISRCTAPLLANWLRQPARKMYLLSLCLLIISRTSLIFTRNFISLIVLAIGLGLAKGVRSVYMALVVPSYVPIQKLPNASGIQMLTNGVILICAGPVFGLIRDNTGNYTPCIILINCVTALTILMWTIEMIITRRKQQNPTLLSQPIT